MSNQHDQRRVNSRILATAALAGVSLAMTGCGLDSFMDPSRTGRFEMYPTTINVLDRIDAIEHERNYFAGATTVQPEDLVPSELSYYLYPGDTVTLSIFELIQPNQWSTTARRIDAGGYYRVAEIGDVRAAGLTVEQFQAEVIRQLQEKIIQPGVRPQVDVVVEQAGGLRYTVYGYLQGAGVFNLQNPDLRLIDALAIAGGVPVTTEKVYVVRTVPLTAEQRPTFDPSRTGGEGAVQPPAGQQPVDIDTLIDQLPNQPGTRPNGTSPGMLQDAPGTTNQNQPPIDIDALEPARVQQQQPPVDVDDMRPARPSTDASGDTFIFDEARGEWVRVRGEGDNRGRAGEAGIGGIDPRSVVRERIIEVDYKRLSRGDSSQNIVIRPDDRIYVDGPEQGLVYIDGEVNRIGVYGLPNSGQLTLSRAITAGGGLGPIAIPERVDLTRRVGPNREATIRVNLAAIRQRTEPDIVLKPDDHIIVGTTFWATPLAVFRNGFRVTYGFGFLFDRNFADDILGVELVR